MNPINIDYLLEITINDQAGDNRRLFIAALIMKKCPALQPHTAAKLAVKLSLYGSSLQDLAEIECNSGHEPHHKRSEERYREKFVKIARALGFEAELRGDPRGCVAKLIDPDDPNAGDNFGGGWGMY